MPQFVVGLSLFRCQSKPTLERGDANEEEGFPRLQCITVIVEARLCIFDEARKNFKRFNRVNR